MSNTTESATVQPVDDTTAIADLSTPSETIATASEIGIEEVLYDSDNPLYDRLNRLTKPHRWWVIVTVALGLIVGIGQNFPSLLSLLENAPNSLAPFFVSLILLFYVGSIVAAIGSFLTPILIAANIATLTASETTADSYELVLLTDLTNTQIIRAYLRVGIRRTRALWAFYIALTLPAVFSLFFSPQMYGGASYIGTDAYIWQALLSLLIRGAWVLLAFVWGVWIAQRVRRPSGAITGAVLGMFIAQMIYTAASTLLLILSAVFYADYDPSSLSRQNVGYALLGLVLALIVPFLALLLYMNLPYRVRRRV